MQGYVGICTDDIGFGDIARIIKNQMGKKTCPRLQHHGGCSKSCMALSTLYLGSHIVVY